MYRSIILFFICLFIEFGVISTNEILHHTSRKNHHKNGKNDVLGVGNVRQVCMDVCRPPYFNSEYPVSNNYPFEFQTLDDQPNIYDPGCYYRKLMQRYYPTIQNEPQLVYTYKKLNKAEGRNFGDYMSCQIICYPVLQAQSVQQPISNVVSSPRPTKPSATPPLNTATNEVTMLPPETTPARSSSSGTKQTTLKPNGTTVAAGEVSQTEEATTAGKKKKKKEKHPIKNNTTQDF